MKRLLLILLCILLVFPAALAEDAQEKERLPDEVLWTYYDNSMFVGDSMVTIFRNYVRSQQEENPAFFSGISFYAVAKFQLKVAGREGVGGSEVQLRYRGSEATMGQIMEAEQPGRVFILAGLNDRIHAHLDRADLYVDRIMSLRDRYAPDTKICFFSLAPVTKKVGAKRQQGHDEYNAWLEAKCASVGAVFIDIATGLKGEDGFLRKSLSSDGEYHLNDEGNAIWAQTLLDFAQSRYEAGLWTPAEADGRSEE